MYFFKKFISKLFMLLVSLLSYELKGYSYDLPLNPGTYSFRIAGAQGGVGCDINSQLIGGYGAEIEGEFELMQDSILHLVAGSKPDTQCSPSPVIQYAKGDGQGGNSGSKYAGAGGGYSSISIDGNLIAIAGGGGGAGYYSPGSPAGGFTEGKSYQIFLNEHCVEDGRYFEGSFNDNAGKSADKHPDAWDAGAGGGGGYFGGSAGTKSRDCLQGGTGGSSWYDTESILIKNVDVKEGTKSKHIGDGIVIIENITVCNMACTLCVKNKPDICYRCRPGYTLKNNQCVKECTGSTYLENNQCKQCMTGCQTCQNGDTCDQCTEGYHREGSSCFKDQEQIEIITTTEHEEDLPTPSQTPVVEISTTTHHDEVSSATEHQENSTSENGSGNTADKGIGITNDNSKNGPEKANGNFGKPLTSNDKPKFPIWIIGVIVGGAALIAAIIGIVVCKSMKKTNDESIEMQEEEPVDFDNPTATTVTVDNPLYTNQAEEDPFKSDFNSEAPKSNVFEHNDIEELEGNSIIAPVYEDV